MYSMKPYHFLEQCAGAWVRACVRICDGGSMHLLNVGKLQRDHTALHPITL
jgi:hypothetical protein